MELLNTNLESTDFDYTDLSYEDIISSAGSSFSCLEVPTSSPFSSRRQSATSSMWSFPSGASAMSSQQAVASTHLLCGYVPHPAEPFIAQPHLSGVSLDDPPAFELWQQDSEMLANMNPSARDASAQCNPLGFSQLHGAYFEPLSDLGYYPWLESENDGYRSAFTVVPSQTFAVPLTPRPTPVLGESFQEAMATVTTKEERSVSPDYSCQEFDDYKSVLRYRSEDRFSASPVSTEFGERKLVARGYRSYKKSTPKKRHKIHNGIPCTVEPNSSKQQCIYMIDGRRCPSKFKRREHLKRHYDTKHGNDKPFKCDVCEREFNRADNRNQHYKTHVTPSKAPRNERLNKEDQDRKGLTEALKPKSRRSRISKI
ncbi:MAG: hypothetical protein MMC33_005422 [Icmadophila ericetorum]|nr:hypothetical protein [Icmadophila ericetorum]